MLFAILVIFCFFDLEFWDLVVSRLCFVVLMFVWVGVSGCGYGYCGIVFRLVLAWVGFRGLWLLCFWFLFFRVCGWVTWCLGVCDFVVLIFVFLGYGVVLVWGGILGILCFWWFILRECCLVFWIWIGFRLGFGLVGYLGILICD